MRVIAGEFRSRILVAPQGTATRPTMDRARESLFNVLSNMISLEGISVLDLFAGSGALAFEALSRGAARAALVDRDRKAIQAIQQNAQALHVESRVTVQGREVRSFLKDRVPEAFDLIFADPPYEQEERAELTQLIFEHQWLSRTGLCVIEHRSNSLLGPIRNAVTVRELNAGEARFTLLTHATPL